MENFNHNFIFGIVTDPEINTSYPCEVSSTPIFEEKVL